MEGLIPIIQKKLSLTEMELPSLVTQTATGEVLTWTWVTWFRVSAPSTIQNASPNELNCIFCMYR